MLPSAGSNRVEVDGTRYRYIVSESDATPQGTVPLAVTVQLRDLNGAYLRALGLTAAPQTDSESDHALLPKETIKPRHVARLIRLGLARGWKPKLSGPPVLLHVKNSDVFSAGHVA
ncbi:MAG: hypothetical protein ACRC8S_02020 [Fimbriiglobus sp.]